MTKLVNTKTEAQDTLIWLNGDTTTTAETVIFHNGSLVCTVNIAARTVMLCDTADVQCASCEFYPLTMKPQFVDTLWEQFKALPSGTGMLADLYNEL